MHTQVAYPPSLTLFDIQEQALQNISQELHDNIGQILMLVKLNLSTIDTSGSFILHNKIQDTLQLVAGAIKDVRGLSHCFSTEFIFESGLSVAVKCALEIINKSKVLTAQLFVEGNQRRLENKKELMLFRMVQEAIHNTVKHASASNISIYLNYYPGYLTINIIDNGCGFLADNPLNDNNSNFSLGLKNMLRRAKAANAEFKIASSPGQGTRICIKMQYDDLQAQA